MSAAICRSRCGAILVSTYFLLFFIACGGGSGTQTKTSTLAAPTGSGNVSLILSDDATEDWATIGVKVLKVALVPQGGGSAVTVYTAPSTVPSINLVQLDQLGEVLANVPVPEGTYSEADLTLSANSGDVSLVAAADPEAGFPLGAGQRVDPAQIQIQGATGAAGSKTAVVKVKLVSPLSVTANGSNLLDLEFDLKHPALIVQHFPPSAMQPTWAVNFNGPVRHRLWPDLTRLILRHMYGTVTSVAGDSNSIVITRDFPTYPVPASGQVPIATTQSLTILADSANGTLFYDVDAKTRSTIRDFSSVASLLPNKYVRVAARYQQNGTLVAVRIWASSSFQSIWLSPEGHIVHVDTAGGFMRVSNEDWHTVRITVDANTKFFFRSPYNALSDATPIGQGLSFFAGGNNGLPNIARGFKVHVSLVDPLASPWVADTVDIEIARYDGIITAASSSGFNYDRRFVTTRDNYIGTINYIADSTANGRDASGNPITGFYWWDFAFPTLAKTGNTNCPNGSPCARVDFADTINSALGVQKVWGISYARWGDGTSLNTSNWYADWAVLLPTPLPVGPITSAFTSGSNRFVFSADGTPVTVELATAAGSATLVYQVDKTANAVTITPKDISDPITLNVVSAQLTANTEVHVYGIPQHDGSVRAYVLFYYTGTAPQ